MTETMGVDKPFNCDVSGCGMRFTNEDHLTVHRKKHEMCLSLNSESKANSNNFALFVDQTPTPTRFIRNCEEVGLFQDLQSVNPFEEHFRKAAESVKMGNPPIPESLQVPADGDILNTPSVLIADLEDDSSLTTSLNVISNSDSANKLPLISNVISMAGKDMEIAKESISTDDEKMKEIEINGKESETAVQPDVETSILPFLSATQPSNLTCATSTQVTSTASSSIMALPTSNSLTNLQSVPSTIIATQPMVQFILKFPDGSSIPVHVPSASTDANSSETNTISQKKMSNLTQITTNISSLKSASNIAKLKLRESLTQGSSGESRALRLVNEQLSSSLATMQYSSSHQDTTNGQSSVSPNKRRFGSEDNDIKRQRFLERNRAAATRCRQKRKQWIQSLEGKADELAQVNQQLQNEVALLRTEVSQLKSMLLAHKDCPVTQQQQRHLANLSGTVTTVVVGGSSKFVASGVVPIESDIATSVGDESGSRQLQPVYRTIMSREEAIALLTGSSVSNLDVNGIGTQTVTNNTTT